MLHPSLFSGSISEPRSCLHAKISVTEIFKNWPQNRIFQFEVAQIRGVLQFLGGSDKSLWLKTAWAVRYQTEVPWAEFILSWSADHMTT